MLIQGKITSFSCIQTYGVECVFNVTVLVDDQNKYIFSLGELNYERIVNCIKCDKITLRVDSTNFNLPPKLNSAFLCNNESFELNREPSEEKPNSIAKIFENFENSLQKVKNKIITETLRPLQRKRKKSDSSTDDLEFLNSDNDDEDTSPGLFNHNFL